MARYLFAFNGPLPLPADDLRLIQQQTQLLDTSRRTVLVDADTEQHIQSLAQQLPDWTVSPEIVVPIPGTRPTVRSTPD
ncbi:hypothetical protein CLV58_10385 [Spirosoma oryzae]|uniref:Uncharacterized protein n=1 Tax=Spirosoma oryzae TaxID=1469603 RepID=A0A2T0TEL8_9BACT|nr:hypothetical protein [Spirosoma oryzae]PRY44116.1 hypothetical protein CLV58_10385 [Spirosoma oryzae]